MRFLALSLLTLNLAFALPVAEIDTNFGKIKIDLKAQAAPKTVENFINYAQANFYDLTVFHRVIKDFMIQGGGFDENLKQKATQAPIVNESKNGLSNLRGTVAMARTQDPHSATSQFFINSVDNLYLDAQGDNFGYAVFGEVIEGMEVVDKISQVQTGRKNRMADVPQKTVLIKSIKILENKE